MEGYYIWLDEGKWPLTIVNSEDGRSAILLFTTQQKAKDYVESRGLAHPNLGLLEVNLDEIRRNVKKASNGMAMTYCVIDLETTDGIILIPL